MRVFVLGNRGMLGHVVVRYLAQQGCEVLTSPARYTGAARDGLVAAARDSGCSWVINAIGRIKQKSENTTDLYLTNTVLPLHLAAALRPGQRLVHASTDCVFSGRRGRYRVDDPRDAEDVYGISKILGEAVARPGAAVVIRTSIIGPELGGGFGLMGWFLRQTGEVNGYTNHFWNGLTTLEWAKVCQELIAGRISSDAPVIQPGSEPALSKCDLLRLIGRLWSRDVVIRPVAAGEAVDRTLVPTLTRPDLEQQLRELKMWYESDLATGAPARSAQPSATVFDRPTL